MFTHSCFQIYSWDDIPLNRDLYLRDEIDIEAFEGSVLACERGEEWHPVGYVSHIAARGVTNDSIELTWFVHATERFHQVSVSLPRDQFVVCVGSVSWDEQPSIFVKSEWLKQLHQRPNCIFGLVDAVGFGALLSKGFRANGIKQLRSELDTLAAANPAVALVSFADSVIVKSSWTAGYVHTGTKYSYTPENVLQVYKEIRDIFSRTLGVSAYGIFTQGTNEFIDGPLLHVSAEGRHVCMNSLGAPFADLMSIDSAARTAIRDGRHERHDLYLEELFFGSLQLSYKFKADSRHRARFPYPRSITKDTGKYLCTSYAEIAGNLPPRGS